MAIRSQLDFAKASNKKARELYEPIDFTDQIRPLLGNKNREIVELAILTAAYSGAILDDEVDAVSFKKSPETLAAKALYNAKRERPLPESMSELAKMRVKSDKEFQELSAALSTFDPTSHPFCYAAQAIGIAKETEELEFLHEMLTHRDIRVQMDAAHAMELVGDEQFGRPADRSFAESDLASQNQNLFRFGSDPSQTIHAGFDPRDERRTGTIASGY